MKRVLVILALVAAGYLVWRFAVQGDGLVLLTRDSGPRIAGVVTRFAPGDKLVVRISNPGKACQITEISVARTVADRLGLSAPSGFGDEPLPLAEEERQDPESVAFVERFNAENVRWVGPLEIPGGAEMDLTFPVGSSGELSGRIAFQYETRFGVVGSISSFWVDLEAPAPED